MARFEFRLQALLTLRDAERERCRAELAAAHASTRDLRAQRDLLAVEIEAQRRWFRAGTTPGPIALERLRSAAAYEAAQRERIAAIAAELEAADAQLERCLQTLAEADGEVRVLEKLRERQLDQFRQKQATREARQWDEAAVRAHGRC